MVKQWAKRVKNVVLVGMPGSGKSTFGRIYARYSHRQFLDFDKYLEHQVGKPIAKLIEQRGEAGFREIETQILHKLEQRQYLVIAMGGGTICNPENLAFAKGLGLLAELHAPVPVLAQRLWTEREASPRPLLADCASEEELTRRLEELHAQRAPFYEEAEVGLDSAFSGIDAMQLQLAVYERRLGHREYQRDVGGIIGRETTLPPAPDPSVRPERPPSAPRPAQSERPAPQPRPQRASRPDRQGQPRSERQGGARPERQGPPRQERQAGPRPERQGQQRRPPRGEGAPGRGQSRAQNPAPREQAPQKNPGQEEPEPAPVVRDPSQVP